MLLLSSSCMAVILYPVVDPNCLPQLVTFPIFFIGMVFQHVMIVGMPIKEPTFTRSTYGLPLLGLP